MTADVHRGVPTDRTPDPDVLKTLGLGRSARFGRLARRLVKWLLLASAAIGIVLLVVHLRR